MAHRGLCWWVQGSCDGVLLPTPPPRSARPPHAPPRFRVRAAQHFPPPPSIRRPGGPPRAPPPAAAALACARAALPPPIAPWVARAPSPMPQRPVRGRRGHAHARAGGARGLKDDGVDAGHALENEAVLVRVAEAGAGEGVGQVRARVGAGHAGVAGALGGVVHADGDGGGGALARPQGPRGVRRRRGRPVRLDFHDHEFGGVADVDDGGRHEEEAAQKELGAAEALDEELIGGVGHVDEVRERADEVDDGADEGADGDPAGHHPHLQRLEQVQLFEGCVELHGHGREEHYAPDDVAPRP